MVSFTAESTIHGVTFIFGPDRKIVVRIFWSLIFIASICGLCYYIQGAYIKWKINPDILTKKSERDIRDFPMPALTICPHIFGRSDNFNISAEINKTKKNFNSHKKYWQVFHEHEIVPELTDEMCINFIHAQSFCYFPNQLPYYVHAQNCNQKYYENLTLNESFFQLINERSLSVDHVRIYTIDSNSDIPENQTRHKKVLVSKYGLCYSINLHSKEIFDKEKFKDVSDFYNESDANIEWSNDKEYFTKKSTTPGRFPIEDRTEFFQIDVTFDENDLENICGNKTVRLIIHPANEIPTEYHETVADLSYGMTYDIEVNVESSRMSEDLRKIDPEYRRCYFEDERKLKYFNKYSEVHCKLECFKEYMSNDCDIIDFPREKGKPKVERCGLFNSDKLELNANYTFILNQCHCMPLCNSVKYNSLRIKRQQAQPFNTSVSFTLMLTKFKSFIEETEQFSPYSIASCKFYLDLEYLCLFLYFQLFRTLEVILDCF